MTFIQFWRAIAAVPGGIQQDLEAAIASVERLVGKDKRAAGRRMSHLGADFVLNKNAPVETRFSIVDAALVDAGKNGLV